MATVMTLHMELYAGRCLALPPEQAMADIRLCFAGKPFMRLDRPSAAEVGEKSSPITSKVLIFHAPGDVDLQIRDPVADNLPTVAKYEPLSPNRAKSNASTLAAHKRLTLGS